MWRLEDKNAKQIQVLLKAHNVGERRNWRHFDLLFIPACLHKHYRVYAAAPYAC